MGLGQQSFLYPLFFRESIYVLAYDHGLNGLNRNRSIFVENADYDKKYSSLIVKRLIWRMYEQNRLIIPTTDLHKKSLFGTYESFVLSNDICFICSDCRNSVFPKLLGFSFEGKQLKKSYNLQSIHSIFPFLEDKLSILIMY